MTESRFDIGMKVRKEVLGSEHVEQSLARATEFDADFRLLSEARAKVAGWLEDGSDFAYYSGH